MSAADGSDNASGRDEKTSMSKGGAQLVAACEKLTSPSEEESKRLAWESVCNDALGHMACEGALFIDYERESSGKIDYGRHARVDPRFKLKQWRIAPMTLLPAPISSEVYDAARETSMAMCRLLDAISTDYAWLESTFRELSKLDEWTRRMLSLARLDDGGNRLRCHCIRADYMEESDKLNMIEVNPFAASLAGHAESMSLTHRRLVAKYACADQDALSITCPANHPSAGFADCLAAAVTAYENRFGRYCTSAPPVVAVITVAEEDNELDHRKLERSLYDKHGIAVVRVTIAELVELLCAEDREIVAEGEPLVLQLPGIGEREVAVCYFRLCAWGRYGVEGWRVREAIANSRAVEVPSAAAHLAGLKRAQVEWSSKRGLDRLGDKLSASDKEAILRVALPQFALDTAASALQAQSAISIDLNRAFVAKPVRQIFYPDKPCAQGRDGFCGGHPHVFDRAAVLHLATQACTLPVAGDARGWIIQAVANPRPQQSLVLVPDASTEQSIVSSRPSIPELGIFVAGLIDGPPGQYFEDVIRSVGHLVRSKHFQTQDGGICRGNAVIDSPLLF